jgi:hypothetical protein
LEARYLNRFTGDFLSLKSSRGFLAAVRVFNKGNIIKGQHGWLVGIEVDL